MLNWWNELSLIQQIFALIALPSTLILLIQTILLLFGIGDGDGGSDGIDIDGEDIPDDLGDASGDDGLALFSIRGIVAMLCVMGWSGIALLDTALPPVVSVLLAVLLGLVTLVGFAYLMKLTLKLQSSGNIDYGNAIGKVAQVYIPIPPNGSAHGKVTLTLQEKYIEVDAITTAADTLQTGAYVRVVATDETGTLVVEPLAQK